MRRDVGDLVSTIYNDCYMVRHYERNKLRRHQAIQKLGATLQFAFSQTDEYEPLIQALLEGLRPIDRPKF